jgi:hypothetical protein
MFAAEMALTGGDWAALAVLYQLDVEERGRNAVHADLNRIERAHTEREKRKRT